MHGSLIDSHHRLSLTSSVPGALLSSSSSVHTLTDDEQTKSLSKVNNSFDSLSTMHLKRKTVYIDHAVETADATDAEASINHSTNFFRWTPGYRHVMLTFGTICLFAFMTGVEYAVILPTVYDYVRKLTNANIYVGLILSSYSISGSITGIIMGKISDMTGKVKFLILISAVFEISGNILYFVANNIHIVLLGRLIAGVGMGAVPPILADVAHRTTEGERTKAISVILGCRQLGLLIGPCFTLLVRLMNFRIGSVHVHNLNGPGFLMATIWLILVVVCWLCYHDRSPVATTITDTSSCNKHVTDDSVKEKYAKSDHSIRQEGQCVSFKLYCNQYIRVEMFVLFLATFITYFNQTALETIVAAFTEKNFYWTTVHTSILFAFAGLEIIIVYISLVKIFSKRVEDQVLLIFGFLSLTLACMLGTFFTIASNSFGWFTPSSANAVDKRLLALFIVFVVLDLLALPFIAATSVSLFTKLTIKELQGFSQGLQRFTMGTGTIVGPLFASLLLNRLHIMMTAMLVLTLLTLVAILIVIKRLRPSLQKVVSNEIKDANNNISSLEPDVNEQKSALLSKNCYVTLVQHDDNCAANSSTKDLSNNNTHSRSDIQSQSQLIDNNSINALCQSDEQTHTLKNS
ncbi:unnamed protein product [Rotaria magnacalcarata]|uniref:Major facilitator superfamily (MFS) profile domain-containing protein n=2 Tax=Rotaria magnacalcarata TaxID=392030 RepID=A0A815XGS9_9BILA|nr:unnamed protein product [Rotaria magnacalcarata]CAF1557283.1 unnamed protein product [Rotaria magnacalcarata]CAF3849512.1 unnamed protein product [Rotaria magnacalcarata]